MLKGVKHNNQQIQTDDNNTLIITISIINITTSITDITDIHHNKNKNK
jgi:hypothetical protein